MANGVPPLTHDELVVLASRWLKGTAGCSIVLSEIVAITPWGEVPDAIGWKSHNTILVECKTSRSDFLADRSKHFRLDPTKGMGFLRYFFAPAGIINMQELPAGWGLLELTAGKVRRVAGANPKQVSDAWGEWRHPQRCVKSETVMLLSGLNRIRVSLGEAEFRRLLHRSLRERKEEQEAA